jgi:hypothetical protein
LKNWGRTIVQKTTDGEVVGRYSKTLLAAQAVNPENPQAGLKAIWRVLEGQRKSYKGFYWVYDDQ